MAPGRFPPSSVRATRRNRQTLQQNSPVLGVWSERYIKRLPQMLFRRKSVIALLYTLIGFSLISTISFWSFLSHVAALRSISVDTQGKNVSNLTSFATEQNSLQWRDAVKHLNVGELFAIKPANQKETDEKSSALKSESSTKTENNRPYFITKNISSQVVCPDLEIPGLVEKKVLDLNKDVSMNQSEIYVLGEQIKRLQDYTKQGNRQLYERYNLTKVRKPIMDSMSQLAVKVGNYSWFPGGHWKPTSCLPRWKVAIIIPYRNRSYHLPIILKYLTPMLRRQLLEFAFYVVEQNNSLAFNRAMLMNVGFLESLNFSSWNCFIFHDVDHVPLSELNYYGCSGMPRHFLSGADRWKYKLPYPSFFGAVSGLTAGNIRAINGFPNVYWGWGGEDDEIWERVKEARLPVSRPKGPTGFYNVITHHHKSAPLMKERMKLLKAFKQRHTTDGLNNIRYKKPHVEFHPLYTNIAVDIQKLSTIKQQPASPAKLQEKDTKIKSENKPKGAKKAVENGKVNAQGKSQNETAQPATKKQSETKNNGKQN